MQDRVGELLARWQAERRHGVCLSVEELCRDCPELAGMVAEQLSSMQTLDVRDLPGDDNSSVSGRTNALPAREPDSLPVSIGGYRVERLLGEGGMGAVYLAHDDKLGRAMALKTMRPEVASSLGAAERFLREARAVARIEHDNVIPIWQVGDDGGTPFIAMPLLQGESLSDRLAREPISPPALILKVGREVADGLAAAHAKGMIHRDIKPANIWLEGDLAAKDPAERLRRCKVLDFGLARPVEDETHLTATGSTVGSPAFMSPEQARGLPLDHRTDLFSLGVVLYRMACGRQPFAGKSVMSILTALAVDEPKPPSAINRAIPAALSDLIMKLLAKDPTERPASARIVSTALREIDSDAQDGTAAFISVRRPTTAPAESDATALMPADSPSRGGSRKWWAAAGLVGIVTLVIAVLVVREILPGADSTDAPSIKDKVVKADKPDPLVKKPVAPIEQKKPIPEPKPKVAEPNRRAAEWVLACGGKVKLSMREVEREIAAVADLPTGPFKVVTIDLNLCKDRFTHDGFELISSLTDLKYLHLSYTPVKDADLVHVKDLPALFTLSLQGTGISDRGLKHLEGLTRLHLLIVNKTSISDAGLAHLKQLRGLATLSIGSNNITDAGLEHLQELTGLTTLEVAMTGVSGRGLRHLKELPLREINLFNAPVTDISFEPVKELTSLTHLTLHGTKLTDAGLIHLKGLTRLKFIDLGKTGVTDAGLDRLKGLPELAFLNLQDTGLTDAAVDRLRTFSRLQSLQLQMTKLTPAGVQKLVQALPGCQVTR